MTQLPVDKKPDQKTSIWEIVDDVQAFEKTVSRPIFTPMRELGLDKWSHWPSPYNFEARIRVLACEDSWQAEIELYATAFAWWFYSNVVPSPVEITRKIMLGGYRCGFYTPIRIKSLLSFFIGNKGVKFLAELIRPATTALFWWWVASSIFAALDTWHTVAEAKEDCEAAQWECLIGNGFNTINTPGFYQGASWDVLQDTDNHYLGGSSVAVFSGSATASGWVAVSSMGMPISGVEIEIRTPGGIVHSQAIDGQSADGIWHGNHTVDFDAPFAGACSLWVKVIGSFDIRGARIDFARFTVTGQAVPP